MQKVLVAYVRRASFLCKATRPSTSFSNVGL